MFTIRTKRPTKGNKWYTGVEEATGVSNCITKNTPNKIATEAFAHATIYNCVSYCWGRYFEAQAVNGTLFGKKTTADIRKEFAKRVNGDPPVAWKKLNASSDWFTGSKPCQGAIAFYSKNSKPNASGHVSFVEKTYNDGCVDFSNCNYSTRPLWAYQTKVNPRNDFNGYTLLGYLYPKPTYKTTQSGLRMRSNRSTNGVIVDVIPKGAKVPCFDSQDGWALVVYNGKEGYCSLEWLA